MNSEQSDHSHTLGDVVRILRHIELENLEHVDLLRAGFKAGIAEDSTERAALCNIGSEAFSLVIFPDKVYMAAVRTFHIPVWIVAVFPRGCI